MIFYQFKHQILIVISAIVIGGFTVTVKMGRVGQVTFPLSRITRRGMMVAAPKPVLAQRFALDDLLFDSLDISSPKSLNNRRDSN